MPLPPSTERLDFREWKSTDLETFHEICSDPRVMKHVGRGQPWSFEETRAFVYRARQLSQSHGYCQWPVIHRQDRRLIGYTGFVNSMDGPEVGWRFATAYWGNGLATEAARAVLAHGFETLGFSRVLATVQEENVASRRVMEKLGMRLLGNLDRQGQHVLWYEIANPLEV